MIETHLSLTISIEMLFCLILPKTDLFSLRLHLLNLVFCDRIQAETKAQNLICLNLRFYTCYLEYLGSHYCQQITAQQLYCHEDGHLITIKSSSKLYICFFGFLGLDNVKTNKWCNAPAVHTVSIIGMLQKPG